MKPSRILIFFICVLALLGVLCSFFPKDGVKVGPFTLEFPGIAEVLSVEQSGSGADPEAVLHDRMAAIDAARDAEKDKYLEYFAGDPARFQFPGDSIEMFDRLFAAFDRASEVAVGIVHYGDSQIEIDRVTSTLRNHLQSRFGGGGCGIMPIRDSYSSYSAGVSASYDPERMIVYGDASMRAGHNRYGPMGQIFRIDSTIVVSCHPMKSNGNPSRYFNRMTLIAGNAAPLYVSCKGQKRTVPATSSLNMVSFELADSTTRASMTISGHADLYGVSLTNSTGINVDNIAMRGCSGSIFTAIKASQLKDYFAGINARLIILQYGGNTVPYVKTEKAASAYAESIRRQIRHIRNTAPDAEILFIGPSDMATSVKGKMQTYPNLPMVVDSLRSAALSSGAAYWDMFRAMGGEGSMVEWVKAKPALAGSDYIHFTPKGAEEMGSILCKSLMLYYDYYKLRKGGGK